MSDYYELAPSSSFDALESLPEAFSMENVKKYPMCRGPLCDIDQYNCISRQSLIEEATPRKLISGSIHSISRRLHEEDSRLPQSADTGKNVPQQPSGVQIMESPFTAKALDWKSFKLIRSTGVENFPQ